MQMELFSTASAREEDLQQRMLGRLMEATNGLRSTLYSYRWKMRKTRGGTMIASLRANSLQTPPVMGWPSPTALSRERSEKTLQKCLEHRRSKYGTDSLPLYLENVA